MNFDRDAWKHKQLTEKCFGKMEWKGMKREREREIKERERKGERERERERESER